MLGADGKTRIEIPWWSRTAEITAHASVSALTKSGSLTAHTTGRGAAGGRHREHNVGWDGSPGAVCATVTTPEVCRVVDEEGVRG